MAETTIITGQYVRIKQVPASIGERLLARIVDDVILFAYFFATLFFMVGFFSEALSDVMVIFAMIFLYLPMLAYHLLCEVFNNGQSIGKKLMNIRVVKADGSTPTLGAYLLRWLLYLVDVPLTGGLGVIVVLVTKNSQRLGDLAAGTMVIKEKNYRNIKVSLDEYNHLTENYRPYFPQAQDLSLEQVNVISKTLNTYNKDRYWHITQLAAKVRQILHIAPPGISDENFLRILVRDYQYYAFQIV